VLFRSVHNRKDLTANFCECLARQWHKRFLLVLVDDGSTDLSGELVSEYPFDKTVVHGDGTLWWAGGLRKGIARVSAYEPEFDDIIWFVNNDTSFEETFLEKALAELDLAGRGAMLAVPILFTDSGRRTHGGVRCFWPLFTFRDYNGHPEKIDCASTRCLLIRWGDLRSAGAFRPRLLPHYLSDLEFTIRAHRRSVRIVPATSMTCTSIEFNTGMHSLSSGSGLTVLRQMFSNRFSANPLHLFIFILLAAPMAWKPACWLFAARSSFAFFLNATILLRLGWKKPAEKRL
jgi:GT2 family glycosyltransferase